MHNSDQNANPRDPRQRKAHLARAETVDALNSRVDQVTDDVHHSALWTALADPATSDDQVSAIVREVYWEIHCYQPVTTAAGFAMIGRLAPDEKHVMRTLLLHKWEEVEHRVWALQCYKALGGDLNRVGQEAKHTSAGAFAVAAVWERLASAMPPMAYLGAEYLFEELTARLTKEFVEMTKGRALPTAGLRFILDHATEDEKHSAMLNKLIASSVSRNPELHADILFAFDCFRRVYPLSVWQCAYERALNGLTVVHS